MNTDTIDRLPLRQQRVETRKDLQRADAQTARIIERVGLPPRVQVESNILGRTTIRIIELTEVEACAVLPLIRQGLESRS